MTSERFHVKATASCQTRNVLYVIEYTKCSIHCIGETENALQVHLIGHHSDIRHKRMEKPVTKHFNLVDHLNNDVTIMVSETIHREDAEYRRRKESHWIEMIGSLVLDGLNIYL